MRRSGQSRTGMVALSLVLAFGLVACGDDDDDGDAQPAQTTSTAVQGQPVVTIDMVDHAFQVSGPLTAGGTIRLSNKGAEFHMMGIGKFKPGKTMSDLEKALSEAGPPGGGGGEAPTTTEAAPGQQATTSTTSSTRSGGTTTTARGSGTTSTTAAGGGEGEERQDPTAEILEEIGLPGGFMGPGESAEVTVPNLAPGSYALLCFLPTEEEGTPHFVKGMVNQLEVVAGPIPAPPTADATYKLAPGKAIEGPATLTPGRHTLRFDAEAGSEDLEPGLARLNAGTTLARLDAALTELYESEEEAPPKGAAAKVPGQLVFSGFDLGPVTTFYLTVDFTPGNYALVAEDTDVETPGAPKEVLNLRVA